MGSNLCLFLFLVTATFVELEKVRVLLIEMWHRQSDGAIAKYSCFFLLII